MKNIGISLIWLLLVQLSFAQKKYPVAEHLRGTIGTYASPPVLSNGDINYQELIRQLKDLHANTYHWLDRDNHYNLDNLKEFLPLANEANINVWVTLVPPSESPPKADHFSEPYKLDFVKWASELSKLSLVYPNLVAWSVDDFVHNLDLFTPEYVKHFQDTAKSINPKFAFVPCCYFFKTSPAFAKNYGPLLDGILFPYRSESKVASLTDADQVKPEIDSLRKLFDPGFLIVLDIYASRHSHLGSSTADYVQKVLTTGLKEADAVFIYRHQDPVKEPEKYAIIRKGFKQQEKKNRKIRKTSLNK